MLIRLIYALSFICLSLAISLLSAPAPVYSEVPPPTYDTPTIAAYQEPSEEPIVPYQVSQTPPVEACAHRGVFVRMLVTACSPEDSIDRAYYAQHGYEGAIYNIAADTSLLTRGTRMRVPGYMEVSFPDRWWVVDSAGGSIIRRASRRGILQIDVKFRTEFSALRWGRKWLNVEVLIPNTPEGDRLLRTLQPHIVRNP